MSEYSLNVDTVGYPLTVVDGTILTLSLDTVQYPLTVVDGNQLTLSLNGATGPSGPAGANGAAGPNQVTTATTTPLVGYIYGNGTTIAGATAGTSLQTANTVVLRNSSGNSTFNAVGINDGFVGAAASVSCFDGAITLTSSLDSKVNFECGSAIYGAGNDYTLLNDTAGSHTYTLPNATGTLLANTGNLAGLTDLPTARTYIGLGTGDSPTFQGLTLTSGSLTASTPNTITQTWNAAGTAFTAVKVNALGNATSSASSLLLDMQLDSVSKFQVTKNGSLYLGSNVGDLEIRNGAGGRQITIGTSSSGIGILAGNPGNNRVGLGGNVACTTGSFYMAGSNHISFAASDPWSPDLYITRRTAASLRLGQTDAGSSATVTIAIGISAAITWSNHGLSTGSPVRFTTTGLLPTGITAGAFYYVIYVGTNTFFVATSFANALAGLPITTSGTQSGVHTGFKGAIAQTLGVQGSITNTNFNGADFVIAGSQSTGTGTGGSIVFRTAPASGTSSATPNALATRLTIAPTGFATFAGSATFGGNIGVGNITPGGVSSSIYGLNDCYINIGGSGQLRFVGAGTTDIASFIYNFGQIGLNIQSAGHISFTSDANSQGTVELRLSKDGAHILAQRLGTNAQTSRIYTTYTSATNYARLSISAQSDRNRIASEAQTQTVNPLEQTFYTSASDPTTANITDGAFGMWKNSGTGLLKLWANDGGTMKSIVLT